MKLNIKAKFLAVCVLVALFITGCSQDPTPYEINNAENYTVSVRYDANGGTFTTNTFSIVDTYNLSEVSKNSQGIAEIALLSPDNAARKNDAFTAINNGYFLAGWYAERTESVDANGNTVYTYGKKWDFQTDLLKVDANQTYSAETPVLTLYAAWVPEFKVDFYSLESGEYISSYAFNPNEVNAISVPSWNEKTGAIDMYKFPKKDGYTFAGAYYDKAGTMPVETAELEHKGMVDYNNATVENASLDLFVDYKEGEWYRITDANQLAVNAKLNGCYEIMADLDFAEIEWPKAFIYGNFSGQIVGNDHTIKNVSVVQTDAAKMNTGIFGNLTENAVISDVTFENANLTIKAGTRMTGASFGLFAGSISSSAAITNVNLKNGKVLIDSNSMFTATEYDIGLVCGVGDDSAIGVENIQCAGTGDNPESIKVTVTDNHVTFEIVEVNQEVSQEESQVESQPESQAESQE